MKKILKKTAIIFGYLFCLFVLVAVVLYFIGKKKLTRSYSNIPVEKITIPVDPDAVMRGKHIAIIWSCTKCHGTDLGGTLMKKDPFGGNISTYGAIPASNLTSGKGGVAKYYTNDDWVCSIRHGVNRDHHAILFMYTSRISDQDLGDLIAYIKQIRAVDKEYPAPHYGPIIPIMTAVYPTTASSIDHQSTHPKDPPIAATVEYGKYLSGICSQCHGKNIGNQFKKWKQEEFIQAFHTGLLSNGKKFGRTMSTETFRELNDMELNALWLYFHK